MFVTFNTTTTGLVATIGGKLNQPAGIGTVKWTWKDDGGSVHTEQLDNTLYVPKSPINIMSVTELAKQFNDEKGTVIDTKMTIHFSTGRTINFPGRYTIHPQIYQS